MIPDGAIFESFLGTGADGRPIALWDVSALLPKHRTERYKTRPLEGIVEQYVHHSGAARKGSAFRHMAGSARYAVTQRDWPGFAYTLAHPAFDEFDPEGRRIVFRGNPTETRTYHAGTGPNDRAASHVLLGNLTANDLPLSQAMTLPVAIAWLAEELCISPDAVKGHFQAPADGNPKPSCPGRAGKGWILGYAAGRNSRRHDSAYA